MSWSPYFWVNRHRGYIVHERRARYVGYINGDEFDSHHNPKRLMDEMRDDMKYRVERSADLPMVCHGVATFIDRKVPGRNGDISWVLGESIMNEVTIDDHRLYMESVFGLENAGYVQVERAYDTPNFENIIRPTWDSVPDPEDLQGIEPIVDV